MTGLALQKSKIHPKYTVDKAPMQVDNSIKQVDNASLQRRFIKKQREQKPLQGGFVPKQVDKDSLPVSYTHLTLPTT